MIHISIKHISLLISILFTFFMAACDSDEPKENSAEDVGSNGNSTQTISEAEIRQLIKDNVSVDVSYQDYMMKFQISSTLHQHLKGDSIKFGIDQGKIDGLDYSCVLVENQAYSFSQSIKQNVNNLSFSNPFWYYFVFGMEPSDEDLWVKSEIFYNSLQVLLARPSDSLTIDDINELTKLKTYLSEYERNAWYLYRPSVMILIRNHYYTVAQYTFTPSGLRKD